LLRLQRKVAEGKNVIMEGRDIGTVVFPNADVKIYLDASAEERARRRLKQNEELGIKSDYNQILQEIKIRDERDSTREIAPLKKADDAILVDSTNMKVDEVVEHIASIIKEKKK
jgi:cytidylate kinase